VADNEFIDPLQNPSAANADIAALIKSESAAGPKPVATLPLDPFTRLPGGLVLGLDEADVKYEAEVQELNGMHEEQISKARQSGRMDKFYNAILACGTVSIGGVPANKEMLGALLIGDADYLIREIRRATYGDEIEFNDLTCPNCNEQYNLTLTVDDIPVRSLKSSSDRTFEVSLRKGGSAVVRLPVGSDRDTLTSSLDLNSAEQNTLLLSLCVISITDAKGAVDIVANQTGPVKALSIPDRAKLLREITDRQPGPRFDDVTYTHDACEQEVHFALPIWDLFLGL
jgi:hypothetical protein